MKKYAWIVLVGLNAAIAQAQPALELPLLELVCTTHEASTQASGTATITLFGDHGAVKGQSTVAIGGQEAVSGEFEIVENYQSRMPSKELLIKAPTLSASLIKRGVIGGYVGEVSILGADGNAVQSYDAVCKPKINVVLPPLNPPSQCLRCAF